jgi:hypothetical protein
MATLQLMTVMAAGAVALVPAIGAAQTASMRTMARVLEPVGAARVATLELGGEARAARTAGSEMLRVTTRPGAPIRLTIDGPPAARSRWLDTPTGVIEPAHRSMLLPPDRAEHLVGVPAGRVVLVVSYL